MIDKELIMKDAGAVTSSAAATVDSSARVVNVGSGFVKGELVVDISAIEIGETDQIYTVAVQGCAVEDFSTGPPDIEDLGLMQFGEATALGGNVDTEPGRYVIPFDNKKDGVVYPYLRVYTTVAGSETPSVNFKAFIRP